MESVLIIILNWNGKDYLEACLSSIGESTEYEVYDILVVDNGSDDGSKEMVKEEFSDIDLIENNRNLGFSIGNNIGICENPGYDYYLLLNNDTEVHEGWLSEMMETAKSEEAGIIGAKLVYPDGEVQHAGATIERGEPQHIGVGEDPESFTRDRKVDYVTGAAFLIDSQVIDDIGYLDEIFSPASYEETDYCMRAIEAGYETYFSANAVITHHESKTRDGQKDDFRYMIERKNPWKYVLMNEDIFTALRKSVQEIKHFLAGIAGLYFNPKSQVLRAHAEVLRDLPQMIRKRYNRDEFIPSYYCEDIRDYSRRYED